MYKALLISTMVSTVTMAWSLWNKAENISLMEVVSIFFSLFVSLMVKNRMDSVTANRIATIRENHLKPAASLPLPSIATHITVPTWINAAPTPAHVLPTTDNCSRSAGFSVTAGIMDQ